MTALLSSVDYIRFLTDLPTLKQSFAELGVKGWKALVEDRRGVHAELAEKAWAIYTADYFEQPEPIPAKAAREYLAALAARRVPAWVLDMALTGDMKRAAKGES